MLRLYALTAGLLIGFKLVFNAEAALGKKNQIRTSVRIAQKKYERRIMPTRQQFDGATLHLHSICKLIPTVHIYEVDVFEPLETNKKPT